MTKPTLYTFPLSGNCYKIRLLASILDIQLDHVTINARSGEQLNPDYLAVNPRGQIPALVHDGKVFTDSAAILVYLAGTNPDPKGDGSVPSSFYSTDIVEQAQIVDWLIFAATWVHLGIALARNLLLVRAASMPPEQVQAELKATHEKGYKTLGILETKLKDNEWLVGGRPTVADIAVFGYVAQAQQGKLSLENYPAVGKWLEKVKQLPGYFDL
jgi:glutathione S-transferase